MSKRLDINKDNNRITIGINATPKIFSYFAIPIGIGSIGFAVFVGITFLSSMDIGLIPLAIFFIGYLIVIFYAGKNLILRAITYEQIELKPATLIINENHPIKKEEKEYQIHLIEHMRYLGFQKWTNHPIGEPHVDFTGLAEREKIVGYINQSGNIGFNYQGKLIQFGKSIPSWDAEIIFEQLQSYYGEKLDIEIIDSVVDELDYLTEDANKEENSFKNTD